MRKLEEGLKKMGFEVKVLDPELVAEAEAETKQTNEPKPEVKGTDDTAAYDNFMRAVLPAYKALPDSFRIFQLAFAAAGAITLSPCSPERDSEGLIFMSICHDLARRALARGGKE